MYVVFVAFGLLTVKQAKPLFRELAPFILFYVAPLLMVDLLGRIRRKTGSEESTCSFMEYARRWVNIHSMKMERVISWSP